MTDETPETPRIPSEQELAAIELKRALANLGPDTDRALMVTLRLPSGQYVGDVWLSATDITALTDGAFAMSLVADAEAQIRAFDDQDAADPLPPAEDDLTDADVKDVFSNFASLLGSEDGEL
jgi:hypothetical protein